MPRARPSRPAVVTRIALLVGVWLLLTASTQAAATPRIAAANWSSAETLIALGIVPYAVADIANYRKWVRVPAIPTETIDMGLRNQPNLELLAQRPPDLLLTSALFVRDSARLARLMPVEIVDNFYTGKDYFAGTCAMTRHIGQLVGREAAAEALITRTEAQLAAAANALADSPRPVYVVQFSDAQHVRVFGAGGMVGTLFERTPLINAWQGPTNGWGFASVPITRLAEHPEARIVVIKPYPRNVAAELADNRVWQLLPAVRAGRVSEIEPVWTFGGLSSLSRLIHELVAALHPAAPEQP
ncbi:ABC transporter substrate-binding protein [Salinicola sp. RZ23]|uniref:ABC transporter substrate-binding protein n=1 Tax=Salinicola sp. RZ23 TaxID=1949087 RepID=UPI0013004C94|nr:ABC transporter substrate-binding protein [Salinicola sp. RZ23]